MSVERLTGNFKTVFDTPGNTSQDAAEGLAEAIYTELDDPTVQVLSVNGKVGVVVLTPADIGAVAAGYVHSQSVPASQWSIAHGLGRSIASVEVTDSAGTVCMGDVRHIDSNNTVITFGAPFSGKAVLV